MVYVTASSTEEARRLATALVQQMLVACVNILPGVESVYEWQGKLESSQEVMLMIKVRVVSVQRFLGCRFCSFDLL